MTKLLSKELRGSKTWNAWRSMKERCTNPNNNSYKNYGARGITFDPRWNDFAVFVTEVGKCPETVEAISLDRKDNNKNYYKENCRWATRRQQTLNSRLRSDNTSGIKGVYKGHYTGEWVATSVSQGRHEQLYKGFDFFEACCVRKSWEAQYNRGEV